MLYNINILSKKQMVFFAAIEYVGRLCKPFFRYRVIHNKSIVYSDDLSKKANLYGEYKYIDGHFVVSEMHNFRKNDTYLANQVVEIINKDKDDILPQHLSYIRVINDNTCSRLGYMILLNKDVNDADYMCTINIEK